MDLITSPYFMLVALVLTLSTLMEGLVEPANTKAKILTGTGLLMLICCLAGLGLTGQAELWELWILAGGLVFLLAEFAILPGFGAAGIIGILASVLGLACVLLPNQGSDFSMVTAEAWVLALSVVGVLVAVVTIQFIRLSKQLGQSALFRKVARTEIQGAAQGFAAHALADLTGQTAIAETVLRPSGKIRMGHEVLTAMSTGQLIAAGEQVIITGKSGGVYLVEVA